MNEQHLDDLKQFIDSRISQSEARMDDKFGIVEGRLDKVETELQSLRQEMLDGFSGVGEAIEEINKHFDERLTQLEQHPA